MVRLTTKTLPEIIDTVRETLQDSIISEVYELTYQAAVTTFALPGHSTTDPRVLSIERIEGINNEGNYITEEDLIEGTDYDLWQENGTVETGFGAASGQSHYEGITIAILSFKENSIVYIQYKYQVPDFRPILTNFAANSQLNMILSALLSNVQADLTTVGGSVNAMDLATAVGDELVRIGSTITGETKIPASETTGIVQITNNSASDTFSITSSTRFVARFGSSFIQFRSVAGSGSVGPLATANISVIAVEAGKLANVGPYSITEVYVDAGLTTKASADIVITNPPQISGEDNFFNNGVDEEGDDLYRQRVQLTINSFRTSSYSTIEKAILDTGLVSDAKVFDIDNHKGLPANSNVIAIQTPTGNILSPTSLSLVKQKVDEVIGTGQTRRFEQTMAVYISVIADIFVSASTLEDTAELEDQLNNTLINHIISKNIGADIFPSTLLALIVSSAQVIDASFTSLEVTEYVSEVFTLDSFIELSDNAGASQNEVMLQLHFNSVARTEVTQYDGIDAFLDVANTPIDERTNPIVQRAVLDFNNEYRASPLNIFDYFSSVTVSGTRINYDLTPAGEDPIISGDFLIIEYNQYSQVIVDGVRVILDGVDGQSIEIEIRVGVTPSTATLLHADTQQVVTLTGNGLPTLYEVKFDNPQTLDPASNIYWIHLKKGTSNTNQTKVSVDTTNQNVPFNPEMHVDGQAETTPGAPDGTFERSYNRATYQSYQILTGASAFNKIIITSKGQYPESARIVDNEFTFKEFIEE
jgi:uncharacterized phage protein gp47/JayE